MTHAHSHPAHDARLKRLHDGRCGKYIIGLALCGAVLMASLAGVSASDDARLQLTPIPTQPAAPQIFAHSPCDLPCFYGIVPGETTRDEAIAIFQANTDTFIFNPEQEGDVLYADYEGAAGDDSPGFIWTSWDENRQPIFNNLYFEGDTVSSLFIWMNRTVTLDQVITAYAEPSSVSAGGGIGTLTLTLTYPDSQSVIVVGTNDRDVPLSQLRQVFGVDYVYVYTEAAFAEVLVQQQDDPYNVSLDVWQDWLSGQRRGTLHDVIGEFVWKVNQASRMTPQP